MTKCWYCEEDSRAGCSVCGAFICKEHAEKQYVRTMNQTYSTIICRSCKENTSSSSVRKIRN